MHIARVQVEGGFLNGLDLEMKNGLVAIIGARGTGKTSLIELIRFALGAKSYGRDFSAASLEHARSVLDGGEVTVVIDDDLEELVVTRGADDGAPRSTGPFLPPIVFSQKELETVGISPAGRMALIDGFLRSRNDLRAREAELGSAIREVHIELDALNREVEKASSSREELEGLLAQLDALQERSKDLESRSSIVAEKQRQIERLDGARAEAALSIDVLDRFHASSQDWAGALRSLVTQDYGAERWAKGVGADPLGMFREQYRSAVKKAEELAAEFSEMSSAVSTQRELVAGRMSKLDSDLRVLRGDVEKLVEGAGTIARQTTSIRTRIAQLESLQAISRDREKRVEALTARRDYLLDELEKVRDERFDLRSEVAERLNKTLNPKIILRVEKYAQYHDYKRAITEALRGSGLKYNELSARLAESLSPRELIGCVEARDFQRLASVSGLAADRAARVVDALSGPHLGEIASSSLEDSVSIKLLDGTEYKDVADVSAGQRCTMILPIVLQHDERVLVLDQPEDHIDNAFIVDTVIKSLRSRSKYSQIIVSTHNANIPVLGQAAQVVQLVSDGRHGSVSVCGELDSPESVSAITTLMEGGRDAFDLRADFYSEYSSP